MKMSFIKTLLAGLLLIGISLPALGEPKNNIQFVIRNATFNMPKLSANCGNFSYPGNWRDLGRELSYTIRPAGFIENPRRLEYTCSMGVYGHSGDIATFYPAAFNHSQENSEVVLTIHNTEERICNTDDRTILRWQVLVIFSLSVDGQLVKDRARHCFYYRRYERD